MTDVIADMLGLFGILEVPTDFPTFMYWFCSLCAGIWFVRMCIGTVFGFVRDISEVRRR